MVMVCYNKGHFDETVKKAGNNLIVVEFTAEWCNATAHSRKAAADLAKANPQVSFIQVDAEKNRDLSELYDVKLLPTFLFLKNGEKVYRMDHSLPSELAENVNKFK